MKRFFDGFGSWLKQWVMLLCLVAVFLLGGVLEQSVIASPTPNTQPVVAYNIDFGMDLARVEQTIEHYGEEIRDVVEQALRNNVNNPDSKNTAQNTYKRQSALNELLPERRSSAFSKDDLVNLKKTEHPRERLR
ncbi:MAG: hypothetical protein AAFQ74_14780 [Cyanobacteria bacterium J06623_4]